MLIHRQTKRKKRESQRESYMQLIKYAYLPCTYETLVGMVSHTLVISLIHKMRDTNGS